MRYFDILSVSLLLTLVLNMLVVFFLAFLSESKTCLVTVNGYGEAWVEVILLPIIFIAGIITLIRLTKGVL